MSNRPRFTSLPLAKRRTALHAAVQPLLEMLETRSHFSVAPVAHAAGPYTVAEGQSIQISGLTSTDSDGTVASYQWDTNYNASKGFKNRLSGGTWTFYADTSGTRTVALRVVDNTGDVSSVTTAQINITDVAPTLTLTAPSSADEASPVNIGWSYTDPSAADVVTQWDVDWGDGTTGTFAGSATGAAHTYHENDNYVIQLTATQANNGAVTTTTHAITVNNVTPIVNASTQTPTLFEGEVTQVDFSSPNRAGSLDGWMIDWGDGQHDIYAAARSHATHIYADNGNYVATVSAQEPDGGSGSSTVNYTVNNAAPDVTQNNVPATGAEGTAITVGSTVTDAGVNDTETYGWTVYRNGQHFMLPGNTNIAGQGFTFTPTDNGSYVIRLTVVDNDGGSTTVNSAPIVVSNVDPTATVSGEPNGAINEGDPVSLTVTPADAGSEDTFTYAWSVTKDNSPYTLAGGTDVSSATLNFSPNDNGSYVATVVVTDDDGGFVSAHSTAITVNNVAPVASVTAPATADEGDTVAATSVVTDAGSADTLSYNWSVDTKAVGTGGTVTTTGGRGELSNFDWGSDFTLTSRMKVSSSMPDGDGEIFDDAQNLSILLYATKSSNGVTITLDDGFTQVSTATDALPLDTFFDLAVSYDGASGAAIIYVNGSSAGTGTLQSGLGGVVHTHFAENLDGTFSDFGVYHSVLSAQDASDLHSGQSIATAPYEYWDFGNAAGTNSATTTGINGRTISSWNTPVTYSGPAVTWTAYTLPNGVSTTDPTFDFVPADNGTYRINLTVTDDDGGTVSTTSNDIVVANVAPTGIITGDTAGDEGAVLHYSVAASDPGSLDTQSYLWSVTKDGNAYSLGGATVNASTFHFTPKDNGAYVVSCQITDNDGGTSTATQNVTVANAAPVASIGAHASTGIESTPITLTGTSTDAGVLDTATLQWSVTKDGDPFTLPGGTIDNAASFTFTPTDNGNYVVSLVATDNDGAASAISTAAITVANADPTGSISGEPGASIDEGDSVALTATGADAGADDVASLAYAWTITKDNAVWTPLAGTGLDAAGLSFVPTDNGTYVATVTITDKDGGSVSVDSQPIVVDNVAPTPAITNTPSSSDEGTAVTVGSTVTDPGAADTQTYLWSVTKDNVAVDLTGVTVDGDSFTFTPRDNGAYVISLTVTDDDNGTNTTTQSFTVDNVAPALTISGPSTADEDDSISLSVAANDPGLDDTQTYLWSVTRNGSAYTTDLGATNTDSFDFTPNLYGTYVVSAQVTDNDGGTNTATKTITVANVAPAAGITGVPSGSTPEGTAITLHGNATDASGETGLTYAWRVTRNDGEAFALPNGTVVDQPDFTFTPTDNGTYVATLTVTDSGGLTGSASTSAMVVSNAAPSVTLSTVPTGPFYEGSAVTLGVTASDAGSEDTLSHLWTVTKNGESYALPTGSDTAASLTFTPNNDGTYVATCVVTDNDGGHTAVLNTMVVANVRPTAVFTGVPATGDEGTAITIGQVTTDPGTEDSIDYSWLVTKDGQPYLPASDRSTSATSFTFTPTDNGTYVVSMMVSDELGANFYDTTPIVVSNVAPSATISGPTTSNEGTAVTVTAAGTDAGSDDVSSLAYAWSVTKDGNAVDLTGLTTDSAAFNFTAADQGAYVFSVVVTDKDGTSSTLTHNLTVANVAPSVAITGAPSTGNEGSAITVGSTVSDPGVNDVFTYGWSVYKNGQPYALPLNTVNDGHGFTFTPTDNGSYVIRLTVNDADGGTTTKNTAAIAVANVAPNAAITGDTSGTEGQPVSLGSTASDAGADDQTAGFTYQWTAKRGNTTVATGTSASFGFTPAVHGTYAITLKVTDKDGTTTTKTSSIVVANVAPTGVTLSGSREGVKEGDSVSLDASASDVSGDTLSYSWQILRGDNVFRSGTGSDIDFTAARGHYSIVVTATDTAGATATDSFNLDVANVAPTATLTPQANTNLLAAGINFGVNIGDVPAQGNMTVVWDFGDGSTATTAYTGNQLVTKKHVYTARGTYNATATVSDGVDSTVVSQSVTVAEAAIMADPIDATKTALFVTGTDGDDTINVAQQLNGRYNVSLNGDLVGTGYKPNGRVYVYGNAGANNITVTGSANTFVFAGTKGSTVKTGSGNDVIIGTVGYDNLSGGAGRDVIVGGASGDSLHGNDGDDLLFAGGLSKMNDVVAMTTLSNKWTDPTASIDARHAAVKPLFATNTLIADNGGNQLWGEAGADWMFVNKSFDKLRDVSFTGGDTVN